MCGIVGLHLKEAARERDLGALLAPMVGCMATRGADSAGLAFFTDPVASGQYRYSVRLAPDRIEDAAQQAQDLVKEPRSRPRPGGRVRARPARRSGARGE